MFEECGPVEFFVIGRYSLTHSWFMRVNRLANSQALASNAGVTTATNLPESNCLYLARI